MSYIININKIVRESKISEKKERRKKKNTKLKYVFNSKVKKREDIYIYMLYVFIFQVR